MHKQCYSVCHLGLVNECPGKSNCTSSLVNPPFRTSWKNPDYKKIEYSISGLAGSKLLTKLLLHRNFNSNTFVS